MRLPRGRPAGSDDGQDEAPRLEIVIARGSLHALAMAASADPIPTGRAAETAEAAVSGDSFFRSHCRRCGTHGCVYCWQGGYISLCPPCTIERIERLAAAGEPLHPTVLWLHFESTKDIAWMERREREALSVTFHDFSRCNRCRKLLSPGTARSWGPEGVGNYYPHGSACYEIRVSGREPYVPPEEPPLDLGVDPARWARPDEEEEA